jgi:hypothetical protein
VKPPAVIQVLLLNPTPGTTMTFACVIQAGYDPGVVNSALYVVSVPSPGNVLQSDFSTTPRLPAQPDDSSAYSLTCLVPPQGKIGLITLTLEEEFIRQ